MISRKRRRIQQMFGAATSASFLAGNTQSLSGAGTINTKADVVFFTSTGASNAIALPDGNDVGSTITIRHVVKGTSGTGVLTAGNSLHLAYVPGSSTGIATITLTNVGDWVDLMWTGLAWIPIRHSGATITAAS